MKEAQITIINEFLVEAGLQTNNNISLGNDDSDESIIDDAVEITAGSSNSNINSLDNQNNNNDSNAQKNAGFLNLG